MSANTGKENVETVKQIEYFSRALKAPRIREAAARLGEQVRESSWTHEALWTGPCFSSGRLPRRNFERLLEQAQGLS